MRNLSILLVLIALAGCASNPAHVERFNDQSVVSSLSDHELVLKYSNMMNGRERRYIQGQGLTRVTYGSEALEQVRRELSARGIPSQYWLGIGYADWVNSKYPGYVKATEQTTAPAKVEDETHDFGPIRLKSWLENQYSTFPKMVGWVENTGEIPINHIRLKIEYLSKGKVIHTEGHYLLGQYALQPNARQQWDFYWDPPEGADEYRYNIY